MRKILADIVLLHSLIFCLIGVLKADESAALFPIRQNGKFGYINAAGEIVIAPRFLRDENREVRHFCEGLEPVTVDDKVGYIDTSGRMVIQPQFGLAQSFSEGFAAVRAVEAPWKWGYIDKTGRVVIPPQFDDANVFSGGLARVGIDGRGGGYIDKSGTFVVPPQYRSYSPQNSNFIDGLASVEINKKWGFIDKFGKMVIEAKFGGPSSFHEGLAAAEIGEKFATKTGYIDKTGAFAIEPRFRFGLQFSEGLARVKEDKGGMAFIDKAGKIAFTVPNGRWAGDFSDGLVNVQIGGRASEEKWGYVDRSGKWAIEARFQRCEPFYKGLAQVVIGNKMAYINKEGHFVWGPDSGNEALASKLRTEESAEHRRKIQQELLRLAKLIDPANPPLTEQMLNPPLKEQVFESGGVPTEALRKLAADGSQPARQLLEQLLSYTPDPSLVNLSPDMAAMQKGEFQTEVARALVTIGDRFVLETLRTWLSNASKTDGELDWFAKDTARCAVEGLKQFRDEATAPLLETLLKSAAIDRWMREAAVEALAELGIPRAKSALLDALKNERISEHVRSSAAAALVRIGEPVGRKFLLDTYDLYLDTLGKGSSDHGQSRAELEFLGDSELITNLTSKADAEPAGVRKNNINTLLDNMRVSAMPVEQQKTVATRHGDPEIGVRLHAIAVMGRQGKADLIPFLESLRDAPDDYPRNSFNDWNELRRHAAEDAIRRIRMRAE